MAVEQFVTDLTKNVFTEIKEVAEQAITELDATGFNENVVDKLEFLTGLIGQVRSYKSNTPVLEEPSNPA